MAASKLAIRKEKNNSSEFVPANKRKKINSVSVMVDIPRGVRINNNCVSNGTRYFHS